MTGMKSAALILELILMLQLILGSQPLLFICLFQTFSGAWTQHGAAHQSGLGRCWKINTETRTKQLNLICIVSLAAASAFININGGISSFGCSPTSLGGGSGPPRWRGKQLEEVQEGGADPCDELMMSWWWRGATQMKAAHCWESGELRRKRENNSINDQWLMLFKIKPSSVISCSSSGYRSTRPEIKGNWIYFVVENWLFGSLCCF